MEEKEIFLLITRYLASHTSDEENKVIEQWIEQSEDNKRTFQAINLIWNKGRVPVSAEETEQALKKVRARLRIGENKKSAVRKLVVWSRQIAAAILVVGIACFIYYQRHRIVYLTKTTTSTIDSVRLSDGSVIYLSLHSKLRYPEHITGKQRQVFLEAGEAFFKIARDTTRPFSVEINDSKVTVLGTSFNIRNMPQDVELSVNTGKVLFELLNDDNSKTLLTHGMAVAYNRVTHAVRHFSSVNMNNTFWMNKELNFENASLTEVFKSLENAYNVKFVVPDSIRTFNKFNAEFKNTSLENVLKVLRKVYPVDINRQGDEIIIRNK
ncbi:FecR family protein [Pedobacter sp. BS3]|uniref:FecR family protein n=1 Tax=Pedobacter sp. BS3 TaxID=2567937 RepID=UPI0016593299|nr:FecR domain-containing protein [Pedobacter sp. BS3]